MANIGEKAISISAGNFSSGLSYLITTVRGAKSKFIARQCKKSSYLWAKVMARHGQQIIYWHTLRLHFSDSAVVSCWMAKQNQ